MSENNTEKNSELEFTLEDGTIEKGFIIGEAKWLGSSYILLSDKEKGDGDAWILKDVSKEDDSEAVYVEITDPNEWDNVAPIFRELLEEKDIDIIL